MRNRESVTMGSATESGAQVPCLFDTRVGGTSLEFKQDVFEAHRSHFRGGFKEGELQLPCAGSKWPRSVTHSGAPAYLQQIMIQDNDLEEEEEESENDSGYHTGVYISIKEDAKSYDIEMDELVPDPLMRQRPSEEELSSMLGIEICEINDFDICEYALHDVPPAESVVLSFDQEDVPVDYENDPFFFNDGANMNLFAQKCVGGGEPTAVQTVQKEEAGLDREKIFEVQMSRGQKGFGIAMSTVQGRLMLCCVRYQSVAWHKGLRFGDLVLEMNGTDMSLCSSKQATMALQTASDVTLLVHSRPHCSTYRLDRTSGAKVGLYLQSNLIRQVVAGSLADKTNVPADHFIVELCGWSVVGLDTKEMLEVMDKCGNTLTMTLMPRDIYAELARPLTPEKIRQLTNQF